MLKYNLTPFTTVDNVLICEKKRICWVCTRWWRRQFFYISDAVLRMLIRCLIRMCYNSCWSIRMFGSVTQTCLLFVQFTMSSEIAWLSYMMQKNELSNFFSLSLSENMCWVVEWRRSSLKCTTELATTQNTSFPFYIFGHGKIIQQNLWFSKNSLCWKKETFVSKIVNIMLG